MKPSRHQGANYSSNGNSPTNTDHFPSLRQQKEHGFSKKRGNSVSLQQQHHGDGNQKLETSPPPPPKPKRNPSYPSFSVDDFSGQRYSDETLISYDANETILEPKNEQEMDDLMQSFLSHMPKKELSDHDEDGDMDANNRRRKRPLHRIGSIAGRKSGSSLRKMPSLRHLRNGSKSTRSHSDSARSVQQKRSKAEIHIPRVGVTSHQNQNSSSRRRSGKRKQRSSRGGSTSSRSTSTTTSITAHSGRSHSTLGKMSPVYSSVPSVSPLARFSGRNEQQEHRYGDDSDNIAPEQSSPLTHSLNEVSGLKRRDSLSARDGNNNGTDFDSLPSRKMDLPSSKHNLDASPDYVRSLVNLDRKSPHTGEPLNLEQPSSNQASDTSPSTDMAHQGSQNDIITGTLNNEWMEGWNTHDLALRNKKSARGSLDKSPTQDTSASSSQSFSNRNKLSTKLSSRQGSSSNSRPLRRRKRKPIFSNSDTQFSSISTSEAMPMNQWRKRIRNTYSLGKQEYKSLLLKRGTASTLSSSVAASSNRILSLSKRSEKADAYLSTDELVQYLHKDDTVEEALQRSDYLTPVDAANRESSPRSLSVRCEPQFPKRHSQTFQTTEVVLPSLEDSDTKPSPMNRSASLPNKEILELEKKYGIQKYKKQLQNVMKPAQQNGVMDCFTTDVVEKKRFKYQRPYVSRYEWKSRLYEEYSQFELFASSISLHFPKHENWKGVYQKAKANDITTFIFLFLSPKLPCSAVSLLNHISKVVDYQKYASYLDMSSSRLLSTHLNANGTLKKNAIPPHCQYLIRFLKATEEKHTTLLMNNMALSEVRHILDKDLGDGIDYMIDEETSIRVFAWMHMRAQHKLYILVSPTLTLYLPCFYNERKQKRFDFKFSWVLTNNQRLNLGLGRIRGAVGLLGGSGVSRGGDAILDYRDEVESNKTSQNRASSRGSGGGGSVEGNNTGRSNLSSSSRKRKKRPTLLQQRQNPNWQEEATFGAPERIHLTNVKSGSMQNLLEIVEDDDDATREEEEPW